MASTIIEELVEILSAAGVASLGQDLYMSSRSIPAVGSGPFISITLTGGSGTRWVQDVDVPAYEFPGAQVLTRGASPVATFAKARAAYLAFAAIRNEVILDTWYLSISPVQQPYDLGLDDNKRIQYGFNILMDKRPS